MIANAYSTDWFDASAYIMLSQHAKESFGRISQIRLKLEGHSQPAGLRLPENSYVSITKSPAVVTGKIAF